MKRGSRGRIAVTLGDPGGVGPEVALKALAKLPASQRKKVVLIGPSRIYAAAARRFRIRVPFDSFYIGGVPAPVQHGKSVVWQTRMAVSSIDLAAGLAMRGQVDAMVTAPINKAGLKEAGFDMPGHTEYLAEISDTKKFEMMLVGGPLRTLVVTRHVPLKDVASRLTRSRVREAIVLADKELRESFGIRRPRLVVCGLNPHAGEKGTIGREEIQTIAPAVKAAAKLIRGTVEGPLSPDALFSDAYAGKYDAEICMYHDQGLIPLKMISRGHGVNVTLGLPFVRTSPDHGTAYDIAGKGKADPGSMLEAIRLAFEIARHRRAHA